LFLKGSDKARGWHIVPKADDIEVTKDSERYSVR
jgi:hypothetical protein